MTETAARKTPFAARLIPGIIVLLGALATYGGALELIDARSSASWPITDGVISKSDIRTESISQETTGSDGRKKRVSTPIYYPDIEYDYWVDEKRLSGNRVSFGEYGSGDIERANGIIASYPVGKQVTVYYQAEDPGTAVLESGINTSSVVLTLIGLGVVGFGVMLAIYLPRWIRWFRD